MPIHIGATIQITGVKVRTGREETIFDTDEHVKPAIEPDRLRAAIDRAERVSTSNARLRCPSALLESAMIIGI